MGFNTSAITATITAKLTPIGRKKLILTNNNLVTSFSLGDSDANYNAANALTTGQVVGMGGNIGAFNTTSNSVAPNTGIKNFLIVNSTGITKKAVEPQSSEVILTNEPIGLATLTGTTYITLDTINTADAATDSMVNLFASFNLPITAQDRYRFTGMTSSQGGYSDTSFYYLATNNIAVIAIDNSQYGELIDGKTIKLYVETLVSAHTIYSTFQNSGMPTQVLDGSYTEQASVQGIFGPNTALVFCDDIQKPNNNQTLSWATGWNSTKPFTLSRKQPYNFITDSNLNETKDIPVGIAYLDKGFIVLTHPTIVDWFDTSSTATTVSLDSVSTSVAQNITCIANRGEFGKTTNPTFTYADTPRISEIGLYDTDGDMIAYGKTDRQIVRGASEFLALNVKISL